MPVSSYRRDLPELIRSSDEAYSRGLAAISGSSRRIRNNAPTNDRDATLATLDATLATLDATVDARYSLRYKSRSFTSPSLGLSRRADDVASRTRHDSAAFSTRSSTRTSTASPAASRAATTTKTADSAASRTSNGLASSGRKSSPLAGAGTRDSSLSRHRADRNVVENERVGSLISSPKWSRIKETFDQLGAGGVESRSDERAKLRRNHSQSTSSLLQISLSPKRRNPTNGDAPSVNGAQPTSFSRLPTYGHSTNTRINAAKTSDIDDRPDVKSNETSKRISARLANSSATKLNQLVDQRTPSHRLVESAENGFGRNRTETDDNFGRNRPKTNSEEFRSKNSKDESSPTGSDSDEDKRPYARTSNKTDISEAKTSETNISRRPDLSFEAKVKALRERIASTACGDYDAVAKDNDRVVESDETSLRRSCSLRYESDRRYSIGTDVRQKTRLSYSSDYDFRGDKPERSETSDGGNSAKLNSRLERNDRSTLRNWTRESEGFYDGSSDQIGETPKRSTRHSSEKVSNATREKTCSRFDRDQTRKSAFTSKTENDREEKTLSPSIDRLEHRDRNGESKRISSRNASLSESRQSSTAIRRTREKSYSRDENEASTIDLREDRDREDTVLRRTREKSYSKSEQGDRSDEKASSSPDERENQGVLRTSSNETERTSYCSNETLFPTDNETDAVEQRGAQFGDLSTRRSLPKTLDLVNGSTAWKKSNSGSWMKVELKTATSNVLAAQSRVALLARQFNHLGTAKNTSTAEKFSRSISVPPRINGNCENSGSKFDLSPPKYQTTKAFKERCLSLPSSRDSSLSSSKNNSSPNESSTDEDGLKRRKLSLVKQVVQSFEEQASASNSSESGSSRENTPTTSNGRGESGSTSKANSDATKNAKNKLSNSPSEANNEEKKFKTRQRNQKNVATTKTRGPDLPPPRKPLTPKRPLYVNAPRAEDSLLAELEEWLVQKYDTKDGKNRSTVKVAVPNQSFLWKDLGPKLSIGGSPKTDGGEQRAQGNYYSLPFAHPNSPVKSARDDHIYTEASFVQPQSDVKVADNASSCDSDEGWVDVSDTELEGGDPNSPRDAHHGVRVRTKSISSQAGSRKSWRDSVRELAAGPRCILDDETWNHKDYRDIMIWESVEGDDSSLSSTSDHFYEALYEEIVDNGRENGTDVKRTDSFGLKSIVESPVDGNDASLPNPPPNQGPKYDNVSGLKKRNSFAEPSVTSPVEEASQLKRNWSLTKKDIHSELDSKLSKTKPHKSAGNLADTRTATGTKAATSPTTPNARASKRKTLIKFILRRKNGNAVPSTTPPPLNPPSTSAKKTRTRKKGSMFYVRWSTVNRDTRRKSQSENDIAAGETEVDSGNGTSSERLDANTSPTNGGATIKRRPSDIRRPSSPPPLPPVASAAVVRTRGGTKSLEILRPSLSRIPFDEKTKSLDSVASVAGTSGESNREVDATGVSDQQLTRNGTNSERSSCSSTGTRACSSWSSRVPADSPFSSRCRGSVSSSHSSQSGAGSYINVEDLASKPKTLALPFTNDSDSLCSYLLISADLKEPLKSPFEEEPLYQFYHKDAKQRATLWQSMSTMEEDDQMYREEYSDDFSDTESEEDKLKDEPFAERVERPLDDDDRNECPKSPGLATLKTLYQAPSRGGIPSAMELLRQEGGGGQRTLWCEVPEVRDSGILDKISAQDRKIQEATFEVITSEASYLKSLNILMEHFTRCPEFSEDFSVNCVLGRRERHILFSDVAPVRDVSARLLSDLERRWQENIVLTNICDILYEHASKFFSVYVKYCANQVYQDRILKELKATRPDFVEVLRRLESNPICQGLDMMSFLMLPMQRITRMPLLLDAIYHRLSPESPHHAICKLTLATLNKVVAECNEGARRMERMEEMLVISRQLDFRDCKSIPLISASRWLVKKGELTRVSFDSSNAKRTFGRTSKFAKSSLYFFLFTDLLVVSKKKNDESYVVLDYCPRNMVQVFTLEESNVQIPDKLPEGLRNLFQLTMLQNNEFKTVEMILSCPLESDRTRWMEAVTPPISENPDEKIYEEWDCPQVQCVYPYSAQQPDELSLEESDVVNVLRKMPDGWYEGERLRDGQRGWFPASFSVEIISSHIRARNLRQRYRLLMLSQAYVEEQRKAFVNRVKTK